ncbi:MULTISPECIES: MFS transporter [Rhizobium/Agrobacterium group]|uniref:MFS transporter n=1 Tax=Rhizobium/Agrobacterium group TaxID=227290 RepID=UPI001F2B85F5|nr:MULTISPECIES: MFS transporter [Rhizobium/Agrobacterium group]
MTNNRLLLGVSASISFFFWGMLGVSIGALLPNAMETFSLSPFMAGMVFVIWSIGFSVGSFAAERLLRAYGTIIVLTLLSALTAVFSLLQFTATVPSLFYAIYLALGLCGGAIFTASHTLFGELFVDRRSSALAVLDVVFSVGNMAAPLLIVAVLSWKISWQSFYLLLTFGFTLITGLFALQLLGRNAGVFHERADSTMDARTGLNILPLASLVSLAIASFALGATEWTQNVWFVTYALEEGLPQDLARFGLSAFTAGMIASRVFVIWFDGAVRSVAIQRTMLLLALVGETIVIIAATAPLMLLGNVILGAGIGGLFPIFLGRAMDHNPSSSAALSMLMVVSLTLGGQVASFALGALSDRFGVTTAFSATVPIILIMAITFEAYRRSVAKA